MTDVNQRSARFAAIALNVICITYYNIMPLVVGGAADSRGLQESELGFAASAFMGGLAIINFSGFAWLRRFNWKRMAICGNLVAAVAFLIPLTYFSFSTWVLCNLLAGMATGISYGISIACLGDTRDPEKNFALAYAGQTALSASLIFMLPRTSFGVDLFELGHWIVAFLMLFALVLVRILPARGAKTGTLPAVKNQPRLVPQAALIMALLLLLINVMAESAVWAFLERIAIGKGLSTEYASTVIAVSFFAAGAGSLLAAAMGTRFGRTTPFVVAVATSVASVWVLWTGASPFAYFAGVMMFAAAWNLGSPYRMALATRADESGRYATLVPATQTLGAALGPALGGVLIVGSSFFYVYLMSTLAWLATVILFVASARMLVRTRQRPSALAPDIDSSMN